jgi:hypothetical protein
VKLAVGALLALGACVPDLDQRTSIVDRPRVLAVVAEPAEAAPGAMVAHHALVATPAGEPAAPALEWAYCTRPTPPTEDDAVAVGCLDDAGVALAAGPGPADAAGALPAAGCMLFGPDPPGPDLRPRDPDPTGGYYQPVRVRGGDLLAFGLDRIACDLGSAPPAVVRDFRARYRANQNPPPLVLTDDRGAAVDGAHVTAGATLALHAAWPADAAEPYVSYDLASVAVVDRRESLRVSFYATAGRFERDAAGVAEADAADVTAVDDAWTAPPAPGPVTLWTVLRDSRGGAAVARYIIAVD